MTTYSFQWGRKACSGKPDPAHTISNVTAELAGIIERTGLTETWRKGIRPGTPWRLVAADGTVKCGGFI